MTLLGDLSSIKWKRKIEFQYRWYIIRINFIVKDYIIIRFFYVQNHVVINRLTLYSWILKYLSSIYRITQNHTAHAVRDPYLAWIVLKWMKLVLIRVYSKTFFLNIFLFQIGFLWTAFRTFVKIILRWQKQHYSRWWWVNFEHQI